MTKKALLLDMEGPIFKRPNFWVDIHQAYGNFDEVMGEFFPKVKEMTYIPAFEEFYVPKFWTKDVNPDQFISMIEEREYTPGIHDFIEQAKIDGYHTVIISTGPYQLAQRAQKDLSIDEIFANKVIIDKKGRFTGKATAMVDDNNKYAIAQPFHKEFSENIIAIGDSNPDAGLVGCSEHTLIAYNALEKNKELLDRANYRLHDGDLNADVWKLVS